MRRPDLHSNTRTVCRLSVATETRRFPRPPGSAAQRQRRAQAVTHTAVPTNSRTSSPWVRDTSEDLLHQVLYLRSQERRCPCLPSRDLCVVSRCKSLMTTHRPQAPDQPAVQQWHKAGHTTWCGALCTTSLTNLVPGVCRAYACQEGHVALEVKDKRGVEITTWPVATVEPSGCKAMHVSSSECPLKNFCCAGGASRKPLTCGQSLQVADGSGKGRPLCLEEVTETDILDGEFRVLTCKGIGSMIGTNHPFLLNSTDTWASITERGVRLVGCQTPFE